MYRLTLTFIYKEDDKRHSVTLNCLGKNLSSSKAKLMQRYAEMVAANA